MEKSKFHHKASVIENRQLCTDHYLLALEDDDLARATLPGQFVNMKINNREELLLRRPFSVARTKPEQSRTDIIYRVIGKGTSAMAGLKPKDQVDLLGPLGTGFHLPDHPVRCLLLGGGVGVAPLWGLAGHLSRKGNRIVALIGFQSSGKMFGIEVFRESGAEVIVTTDDGSYGLRGLASDHLEGVLKREIDRVYVCGPPLMLKAVIPVIREAHLRGEVSVEEKMGCGFGVCLSCVVNVKKGGVIEKQRVCTEGPVFDLEEIVLNDET
jgi:dihydroorotate dehydrogenase electron transfer subunit